MVRLRSFSFFSREQLSCAIEMEMRKLHMGTMSYGADSMDEVAHQLELAFGTLGDNGKCSGAFFTIDCICFQR